MRSKLDRMLFLLKQYSFLEFILLNFALLIDFVSSRFPVYLINSKNIFDKLSEQKVKSTRRKNLNEIDVEGIKICVRRNSSDLNVFQHVFLNREYEVIKQLVIEYELNIETIVDCGANIGLSTIFFNQQFSGAKILALEPNESNYQLLKKNTCGFPLVETKRIGVWSSRKTLVPNSNFRDRLDWSFSLRSPHVGEDGFIKVDTLQAIAETAGWTKIDFIKIDIEGAEFELFKSHEQWSLLLKRVSILCVEVHEEMGDIFEIINILMKYGFKIKKSGELIIAFRY
ncbi:hypothetical protein MASR2M41_17630 [Flammeovirgaceae bacterium]